MEIARYWRLQKSRYCLEGVKKTSPKGVEEISLSGNSWTEFPSNGHPREEKLMTGITIYQAPVVKGKNGGNGHSRESIEISIPMEASVMVDQ